MAKQKAPVAGQPGYDPTARPQSINVQEPEIEPASPTPQAPVNTLVAATADFPLAHTLAREIEICPNLARLIDAWPTLPDALKAGILAMIDAVQMHR